LSVTVHWRPASDTGNSFDRGTSDQLEILKKHFGTTITQDDVKALRAMAAVALGGDFFEEVADTVERVGAIEIWGTW
jgi:hypothetical protein